MKKFGKNLTRILICLVCLCLGLANFVNIKNFFGKFKQYGEDTLSNIHITELFSKIEMPDIKNRNSLYLVAGGDIMLSRNIGYLAKKEGYDRIFKMGNYNPILHFTGCVEENCVLFFNLESLFNEKDNDIQKGGFIFRANTGNLQTLLQLRGNHILSLSLANNHTINTTYSGVALTRSILSENNIYHAGAGLSTGESRDFIRIEQNGIKLCIGAYSYEGQFVKVGAGNISWNPNDENQIKEDLQKMKNENCDVKAISLHRGAEYKISPNSEQKRLAYSLIDSGADLILGGHSHVPGDYEIYSGKYIFYSFGNFIFDQGWGRWSNLNYDRIFDFSLNKKTIPTYIGLLAGLKIEKKRGKTEIILDKFLMTSVNNGILQPVDDETYKGILERITK